MKKESNKTKARCSRDSKKNMLMYIVKLYIYTPMTHNAKFLSAKISEDKSYVPHLCIWAVRLENDKINLVVFLKIKAAKQLKITFGCLQKSIHKWSLAAWTCLIMRRGRRKRKRKT